MTPFSPSKPLKSLLDRQCGDIPWEKYGVELVLECTGEFLTTEKISPQVRTLTFVHSTAIEL